MWKSPERALRALCYSVMPTFEEFLLAAKENKPFMQGMRVAYDARTARSSLTVTASQPFGSNSYRA